MVNDKVVLFDFDGTIIRGDSVRILFRHLSSSRRNFIINYYVKNLLWIVLLVLFKDDRVLRESRRKVLAKKFVEENCENLRKDLSHHIFDSSMAEISKYSDGGYKIIIISAGFKEIIRCIMPNFIKCKIIANSMYTMNAIPINGEMKLSALGDELLDTPSIIAAFGNSNGDVPMLESAENPFWVLPSGEIIPYTKKHV